MAIFTLFQYYREQWCTFAQPRAVDNISSETFLVTGSNVGLGFEASVHLAKMRPKLLIATSRDDVKCELTRKSILDRAAAPSTELYTWPLELGSFRDVRFFVDKFAIEGNGTLNALVANAGVLTAEYTQTQDGWEEMLQVNYLSTALLSILLLPYLINSSSPDSPSRLVLVSSFAHYYAPELKVSDPRNIILETINQPEFGDSYARYRASKLLGIMFIRELTSRLPEFTPIVACAVNPGFCESEIPRHIVTKGWFYSVCKRLALVRSTEEGSKTLVHAAVQCTADIYLVVRLLKKAISYSPLMGRYVLPRSGYGTVTTTLCPFLLSQQDETMMLLSGIDDRVSEIVKKFLRVDS